MVIFGGLNTDNFLPTELYCLELDPYHAKRVKADDKMKKTTNNFANEYNSMPNREYSDY